MTRPSILDDAAQVLAARAETYGAAAASLDAIAARWSLTLGRTVTPAEVVLCMIDLKLVRLTRNPTHRDSLVDVIGYATLMPGSER
jgi:hypothetical protein